MGALKLWIIIIVEIISFVCIFNEILVAAAVAAAGWIHIIERSSTLLATIIAAIVLVYGEAITSIFDENGMGVIRDDFIYISGVLKTVFILLRLYKLKTHIILIPIIVLLR